MGDLWYEKTEVSVNMKRIYAAWMVLANGYVIIILIDELLAYARSDLTDREKNDLVQFTFAHPLIYCKVLTLYIWKGRIKVVMERLLEGSRSIFSSMELERMSVKQFAKNCFTLTGVSYVTLSAATIEAIRLHFIEGIPVRTVVVYFPSSSQTGFFINVFRFFKEFHWYYIVAMMATMDCLALCSLITVAHKFRVLRLYFRQLRIRTLENKEQRTRKELAEEFKKDFVIGIKLHSDALWCARNVQHSMGPLYSIQVMESVALLVMCLIKLVVAERNITYLLATSAFIFCLIILTGAYMMAAGDITHEVYITHFMKEASLVGTAMFHSGWEECNPGPDVRVLVVVALQMSQVPVYMTAFGVITLSHTNFISKHYFKSLCKLMFYFGMGDLWYEKTEVSYYTKKIYEVWMIVANGFVIIILFDELLSFARTDLTEREKNDLVQFAFAHPLIYGKVVTLYIWKSRIKVVMERLLEGIPVRTEVVYFPNSSQTGFFINVLRFCKEFHWYYIVAMMATMDCLVLCSLITVGHKFRVLRLYFDELRIRTLENKEQKSTKELAEKFKKDFVVGIKLHSDALWCARNVQHSMGPLYSIQVMESVALLVMCLVKLVVAERNITYLLATSAYIFCLIVLTGSYMMVAGDITNEASLVGTAMFHSGWEECNPGPDVRVLVVVALQMSQVPVYMTAFGVITLSHTNFISDGKKPS
ncbi:hypothetical protein PYW07_002619 [Mythimna separata]|uniref:Uncharacterized protein n=1 Tax=Mythimna separata TaxID=271217 RepID=A0AAD7YH41_MYTSE|nr:hypothetical protein PYW07_002619 [Mythimna separata]